MPAKGHDASEITSQQDSSFSSTLGMSVIDSIQLTNASIMEHADQIALRQALNLSNQVPNVFQVLLRPTEESKGHHEERDEE